jgi:choline dehydrogenase
MLTLLDGVTISPLTLNPSNQTRSDSKAGYIDPLPPRSNLVILTGYQVTGITFNGTTDANGNVVASGIKFQAAAGQREYTVNANKEVILRCVVLQLISTWN